MCIISTQIVVGQCQNVSGHCSGTRLVGKMGSQGKKEADNTFVLPAIRTLLAI
jgi:hypothetical protein